MIFIVVLKIRDVARNFIIGIILSSLVYWGGEIFGLNKLLPPPTFLNPKNVLNFSFNAQS